MKSFLPTALSLVLVLFAAACSKPQEDPDPAFRIEATSPIQNDVEPNLTPKEDEDTAPGRTDPVEQILDQNMTAEEIADMDPIPPTADTAAPIAPEEVPEPNAGADEAPAGDAAAAEPAAVDGVVEPSAAGLAGTKWEFDGIAIEFRDEDTVFLKGGPVAQFAQDGIETSYTLTPDQDGTYLLEANVLGRPIAGVWDGTAFVIDGKPAAPQQ